MTGRWEASGVADTSREQNGLKSHSLFCDSRDPPAPPALGTGRHRAQIIYFFRIQIGSQTPSGIGLRSGGPLDRIRPCLGLSRELWIEKLSDLCSSPMSGWGPVLIGIHRWKRPRMRRRRLPTSSTTLGDSRETSGPRIDRIPLARPTAFGPSARHTRFLGRLPSYPLLDAVDATGILTVALPESSARPRPGRFGTWTLAASVSISAAS